MQIRSIDTTLHDFAAHAKSITITIPFTITIELWTIEWLRRIETPSPYLVIRHRCLSAVGSGEEFSPQVGLASNQQHLGVWTEFLDLSPPLERRGQNQTLTTEQITMCMPLDLYPHVCQFLASVISPGARPQANEITEQRADGVECQKRAKLTSL